MTVTEGNLILGIVGTTRRHLGRNGDAVKLMISP